jgi:ribokinase
LSSTKSCANCQKAARGHQEFASGHRISVSPHLSGAPSKGFDAFRAGEGTVWAVSSTSSAPTSAPTGTRQTNPNSTVVVVGSANADLVVNAPRHPRPGETVMGTGFAVHRGGKGANQAVAASRAGASVVMIGRLGNDLNAGMLRQGLQDDAVFDRFIGNCKHDPSGTALITVDDAGENSIVVVPGANALLRPVHVEDAADAGVFANAKVVLAQLEVPLETVIRGFELGRDATTLNILNAAPAQVLGETVLALVDMLVVNEHELAIVTGIEDRERAIVAARAHVSWVVLTLGAAGARIVGPDVDTSVAAHAVDVVDTTGAGDAFCGAFCAALGSGLHPEEAMVEGNAAGALATTVSGAQPSLPTAAAIAKLLAEAVGSA